MSDQKIKQASDKCPLDLIPLASLKGPARVYGYGAKKYAAGNYYTADDDQIAQRYAGAALRHLASCQNPNGLYDMKSIAAIDPESGLPEIDHAICGLLMLRALATKHGALPADPGVGIDPRVQAGPAADPPIGSRVRIVKSTWRYFNQAKIGRTGTLLCIDRTILPMESCFLVKLDYRMDFQTDSRTDVGSRMWVDQVEVVS